MKSCKRVEKYVKCQNDMGRSQNDMPDMRKLQASNTQTSDAACFFFLVKNIRTKTQKLSKHHRLLNPSSLFLLLRYSRFDTLLVVL